uniref:Uncharacterized protein n=1 Tax=Anguilla anguilla TaxID=7936 RepID=A0A0E9SLY0_ANGAN
MVSSPVPHSAKYLLGECMSCQSVIKASATEGRQEH